MPSPGFKSPIKVRGYHSSGLKIVNIFSPNELEKIKNDTEGIIIAKNVGKKKRLEILKKAKEINITVLNLNIDEQIKNIEDFISSKKNIIEKTKKEINQEIKKTEEAKEKSELDEKGKKEREKKEKDKVLTKKI